jgi:hypothetical protein
VYDVSSSVGVDFVVLLVVGIGRDGCIDVEGSAIDDYVG